MSRDRNENSGLIGRGGVALVCFHLARLGHEFVVTSPGSKVGDIWAQMGSERITIEVKTTSSGRSWRVKREQIGVSDIYCLVRLKDGACFLVRGDDMRTIVESSKDIHTGIALVTEDSLPAASGADWSMNWMPFARKRSLKIISDACGKPRYGRGKKVRRILADGSVKTYEYPRAAALP